MTVRPVSYLRAYAAALALIVLVGCQSDSSGPITEVPQTSGRGAVVASTFVESMSAAEITTELHTFSTLVSASNAIDIYRLTYETVDAIGQKTTATGTVILPKGVSTAVPIMSYQHGTVVRKSSVPFYDGYSYSFEHLAGIGYGGDGYIAVMPDYLGLGDGPGLHPYVHARSLATSVVDLIRATKSFCKTKGVQWNNQIFITGYSEGGYATMAAQKLIEDSLKTELPLTASAPMAGPYDMSGTMREMMLSDREYVFPMYLPYIVYSYSHVYGEYELNDIFKPEYASTIPTLFDGLHGFSEVNNAFPDIPSVMFSEEFLVAFNDSTHPLRKRLRDNDLYRWSPQVPTRMYHCTGDEQVPYENSIVALESFQSRGSSAELNTPGSQKHDPCAQIAMVYAKWWFDSMKKK